MEQLFLAQMQGLSENEIKQHISTEYEVDLSEVNKFKILIAYEHVGSWGCDSVSFFLLKEKSTGKLYTVHGSHCSCNGFEGQFEPEECTIDYLNQISFISTLVVMMIIKIITSNKCMILFLKCANLIK